MSSNACHGIHGGEGETVDVPNSSQYDCHLAASSGEKISATGTSTSSFESHYPATTPPSPPTHHRRHSHQTSEYKEKS